MSPDEDLALVRRLCADERGAWEGFVRDVQPSLLRAARAVAREAAEDVVQRVFDVLLEQDRRLLRSFRGLSSLSTWLIGIARRQALLHLRRERVRELPPAPAAPGPLDQLLQAEQEEGLAAALDGLAPRERLILQLHYRDGLPYGEIAGFLGVSTNSVGPLLDRARERLKAKLK